MKKVINNEKIDLQNLSHTFSRYPVIAAYLYGSYARNENGILSDIDLAVLLDNQVSKSDRFDLRLRLITTVASCLKTSAVDLVVMNDAPIYLQFEIIKANQVLYCSNESARVDHEVYIMSRYLDLKYYQERHSRMVLEQIAREGLR